MSITTKVFHHTNFVPETIISSLKPNLTDRTSRSAGQNDEVITVCDLWMGIVHRVDAAEAGQVAVLHIHAGDVVLTLTFCLGAVLLEVVHRSSRHPQAGVAAHDDLGIGTIQPEHVAVDDLAGEDETGNVVLRIDVHLR